MAVYTALDQGELERWLADHGVGRLVEARGIESGIENTNYFVTTDDGRGPRRYVLTLFERLDADEVSFYLSLMQHLAEHGVPCPAPTPARDGRLATTLAGKPAALVTRLPGRAASRPSPAHCEAIGGALAAMHLAGASFDLRQANPRGVDWWEAAAARVRGFLDDACTALLDDEMATQRASWRDTVAPLPRGPIHADLFRDNALFVEDADEPTLGGLIDFYFAGDEAFLFDVAVSANDWCVDLADGTFDDARLAALVGAYRVRRPLTASEVAAWPLVARAAALRFWLSRLDDLHSPRPAQLLTPHDPTHFERILRRRRDDAARSLVRIHA